MDKCLAKRKAIMVLSEETIVDSSKQSRMEINLADLPTDPGLRLRIWDYNPNIRDEVRRAYLLKGPCQPRNHEFPYTNFGTKPRRFNPAWFDEFSTWLEYSVNQNAAYCLCCYLFKPNIGAQAGGDSFVGLGFKNWSKKEKLRIHIGGVNSAHNQAWSKCAILLNEQQHIEALTIKQPEQSNIDYKIHLNASIDCVRFLLRQRLAFRGHDESETSNNRGNFIELLQFLADHDKSIETVTFKNVAENLKLTSSDFQKAILNAVATETMELILSDIGDDFFSVHVDECYDVSVKKQMSVVVRYVDTRGHIIERFLGIEHVPNATSIPLKTALDDLFSRHGLSISNLRGQSYDGASNMQGELGGLKKLILDENRSAYYVHCFAHQLQLTLVLANAITVFEKNKLPKLSMNLI
ncbi:zinc finger MYM-type protein 1-like [Cynara cardunculus var. scolymus]|uniref:zinc finger MYM-type protein 1-like n=1 Tax=Cynara cardunculus var. scolymus TaxID=59895 RepID=UPI000D6295E2|nr:zinc finger MYM-type protein 1-like [Cynara cardunculus var. scolymus]